MTHLKEKHVSNTLKYVLTTPIVIPAGTVLETADDLGEGGLVHRDDRGCMQLYLGRVAALSEGMVEAAPQGEPA